MPTDILKAAGRDPILQFSVFADNKVGRLNDLVSLLFAQEIHVLALTTHDTTDSSIIRIVVNYPVEARELLDEHGYAYTVSEMIAVEIETVRQIKEVTAALLQAEINIHYVYPFIMRPNDRYALALHLEDDDLGADVLRKQGLTVLTQGDIAR